MSPRSRRCPIRAPSWMTRHWWITSCAVRAIPPSCASTPQAALTKGLRGEEMTEFGLLGEAGAVAFTDGHTASAIPA